MITCLTPHTVRNKYTKEIISVPCGVCPACKCLKANSWANRLELESSLHRYTLFLTLTYTDSECPVVPLSDLDGSLFKGDWVKAVQDSSEFLKLNGGMIKVHSVRHIQLFFKRLRTNLIRHYDVSKESRLRYFCAFEFGSTTFRPHYHLLLWFDDSRIASSIKECIYEAWKPFCAHKKISTFFRRNQCSFVRSSCSQYVAGYLNTDSHLPAVLFHPSIRTKHLQSKRPPIGLSVFQSEQVREIIFGDATKISYVRPTNYKSVNVSLWQSLESRYFPKCESFSIVSSADRRALYTISRPDGQEITFKQFEKWFMCKWCSSYSSNSLFSFLFKEFEEDEKGFREKLKRIFYVSRRIFSLSKEFSVSPLFYVGRIENYYSRKNYYQLLSQLEFEQEVVSTVNIENSGLSYLPFLIDSMFYENKRNLSQSVYDCYLKQFNVVGDPCHFVPQYSYQWQSKELMYSKILKDNTKTRLKKDFVANHPEFMQMYIQNYKLYMPYV